MPEAQTPSVSKQTGGSIEKFIAFLEDTGFTESDIETLRSDFQQFVVCAVQNAYTRAWQPEPPEASLHLYQFHLSTCGGSSFFTSAYGPDAVSALVNALTNSLLDNRWKKDLAYVTLNQAPSTHNPV